jgi:hypothetical protein
MRSDRPGVAPGPLTARECVNDMRASIAMVGRRRNLAWAIGYSAVVFVLLRSTEHVYQPYLKASGFDIAETGLIFAATYFVAAAVAHNADALRRLLAERTLIWALLGTLVVTFLALGVMSGPLTLGVLAIQAAANGLYSPLVKPMLNREILDSRRRATVLSVESMIRRAALGLLAPAVGWLMVTYSPGAGLLLCGGFGLACMGGLAATRRRASRAPAPAADPTPAAAEARAE